MANSLKKKYKGYRPLPIEHIHQHLEEIRRGTGSAKPKKGKGSYRRKDKHKGGGY
jgi:hypothetical protein